MCDEREEHCLPSRSGLCWWSEIPRCSLRMVTECSQGVSWSQRTRGDTASCGEMGILGAPETSDVLGLHCGAVAWLLGFWGTGPPSAVLRPEAPSG